MKKILLVEDTTTLTEEIAQILTLESFEVITASNGIIALELLGVQRPDLIITDLLMPRMDGIEFIKQVRALNIFKSIPIIILSAKVSDEDKVRGKEAGADMFIQKPCKVQELLTSINSFFG